MTWNDLGTNCLEPLNQLYLRWWSIYKIPRLITHKGAAEEKWFLIKGNFRELGASFPYYFHKNPLILDSYGNGRGSAHMGRRGQTIGGLIGGSATSQGVSWAKFNTKTYGPWKQRDTWRIIPVSKWLVTPIYKPFRPFGRGTTLLRGLTLDTLPKTNSKRPWK